MKIWKPNNSNCLIWAVIMWINNGGYVVFRKSNYGWWVHALWSPDLKGFWAYTPIKRLEACDSWQIPPVIFKGIVIYNAE